MFSASGGPYITEKVFFLKTCILWGTCCILWARSCMKKNKMNYYNHYFKTNWDNIKNTWKGKKSILNINNTY